MPELNGNAHPSEILEDRTESHGLVTSEKAAEILGINRASFFAVAYSHSEELGAFRLGSIVVCEVAKVKAFGQIFGDKERRW